MDKRKNALITGAALLLMAVIAGFAFGFALPEFEVPGDSVSLRDNISSQTGLYSVMLIAIIIILILDLLVSFTLYHYFKSDHRKMSLIAGLSRVIYTTVFAIATVYLAKNLAGAEYADPVIDDNFHSFHLVWNYGLVIFGIHLLLIGRLMLLHGVIPKVLSYLALVAGASYLLVHALEILLPESGTTSTLAMILMLPMTLGELGLAIWLMVKGGVNQAA